MTGTGVISPAERSGVFRNERNYTVAFGAGCCNRLQELLDELQVTRPLLVTSRSITDTPLLAEISEALSVHRVTTFGRARQNAPLSCVREGLEAFVDGDCDGVISVGGSSCVDVAKGIVMSARNGDLDGLRGTAALRGDRLAIVHRAATEELAPILAVPTTLSGAEFTYQAGLTDDESGRKDQYYHHGALPKAILLDPTVCRFTPTKLWSSTGIKAIDHDVERLYSRDHQPLSDALALESARLLVEYLPRCTSGSSAEDSEARQQALFAAWMAQFSTKNVNVGVGHAVCHQLAGLHDVPHGIAACCILPHAMRFNSEAASTQLARLGQALGWGEQPESSVTAIEDLITGLGLPRRLSEVGVPKTGFQKIAERTLTDTAITGNPRAVTSADEIRTEILEKAW